MTYDTTRPRTLVTILRGVDACGDSITWADQYGTDLARAWTECPRGDWLLWIAARVGVRRETVVLAACACARLALVHVPEGETRPLVAIETAERWARGEATLDEVRVARRAAAYAAADAYDAYAADAYAAYAYAAYAAYAADAADAAAYDAYAAYAYAAYAAAFYAAAAARASTLARCADLVRERITLADMLTALGGDQ